MVPAFKPAAATATSLVAAACLTTAILVPILTGMWAKRIKGATPAPAAPTAPAEKLQVAE
jgi:2-keto-3-deoxygluconate permease